jgi:hypothetical protein
MKKQIVHLSVHQTSKVIAALQTVLITIFFILPIALGYLFQGHIMGALSTLIVFPLVIWLFMYIGYVIICWFYNLIIPWTGGIELEPESVERNSTLPTSTTQKNTVHYQDSSTTDPTEQ